MIQAPNLVHKCFGTYSLGKVRYPAENPRWRPPKSKMSLQKHVFSFITQNALILTPINVLKLNIKLVIADISVPGTCLYLLRFLRYSILELSQKCMFLLYDSNGPIPVQSVVEYIPVPQWVLGMCMKCTCTQRGLNQHTSGAVTLPSYRILLYPAYWSAFMGMDVISGSFTAARSSVWGPS